MVKDALRALGLLEEADTDLEFSMFMMKPDIIMVVRLLGRVFFAVEVKSPEHEKCNTKDAVFGSSSVGGQIWSYLYAMKAAGVENPIGAITTFNKICIVTLQDHSKDAMHRSRVQTTRQHLSTGTTPQRTPTKSDEECEVRKVSYIKQTSSFCATNKSNDELKRELVEESVDKSVYMSHVHEDQEVFPCLLQAIDIAHQGVMDSKVNITRLENSEPLGRRLVFKIGKASYDWKWIPSNDVCTIIDCTLPDRKTQYFYVLGELRTGAIASVYLACNRHGRVCAIRDYHLHPSTEADQEKRENAENEERNRLYAVAKEEERRWGEIYKDRFEARVQYLGGKPCLLMPYGHEIDGIDERWNSIPTIRDELFRFAEDGYVVSDLQFSHVFLDTEKRAFLGDLESLEERTEEPEIAVYKQLGALLKPVRTHTEEQENDTLDWIVNTNNKKIDHVISLIRRVKPLRDFFGDSEEATISRLFSQATSIGDLSGNAKAEVALSMISYFRLDASKNEDEGVSGSQIESPIGDQLSDTSVPAMCASLSSDHETSRKQVRRGPLDESNKRPKRENVIHVDTVVDTLGNNLSS